MFPLQQFKAHKKIMNGRMVEASAQGFATQQKNSEKFGKRDKSPGVDAMITIFYDF
jgi:hypothetical protein